MMARVGGTQPERTTLAAHRTAAAVLVVAMALIRTAIEVDSLLAAVAGSSAALLSVLALALARTGNHREDSVLAFPRVAGVAALAVALLSVAGLSIVLG